MAKINFRIWLTIIFVTLSVNILGQNSTKFNIVTANGFKQLSNNDGPIEPEDESPSVPLKDGERGYVPVDKEDFASKLIDCIVGKYYWDDNSGNKRDISTESNNTLIEITRSSRTSISVSIKLDVTAIQTRGSSKDKLEWQKEETFTISMVNDYFHIWKYFLERLDGGYVREKNTGFIRLDGMLGNSRSVTLIKSFYLRSSGRYASGDEYQRIYYMDLLNTVDGEWLISVHLGKGTSRLDTFDFKCLQRN